MSNERARLLDQLDETLLRFVWNVKEEMAHIFRTLGIRSEQIQVLELIDHGMRHPKSIADAIHWDPPLLSHYLSKLEKLKLIERSLDPHDRRRTQVCLTPLGKEALKQARVTWHEYISQVLSDLNEEELVVLRELLEQILTSRGYTS